MNDGAGHGDGNGRGGVPAGGRGGMPPAPGSPASGLPGDDLPGEAPRDGSAGAGWQGAPLRRKGAPRPRERIFGRGKLPPLLLALIGLSTAIELLLQISDLGYLGQGTFGRLRRLAYEYGAFWAGLLHDWVPNYRGQPFAMFLTHAFLHGGLAHLAMNMITLASLGVEPVQRLGQGRFLLLYLVSAAGGAACFGWITPSPSPMVGASGAIFGVAGAHIAWNIRERSALRLGFGPVLQVVALLIGINLVMWWAMAGRLAWEAHLGGFLAGAVAALLLDRKGRGAGPEDWPGDWPEDGPAGRRR